MTDDQHDDQAENLLSRDDLKRMKPADVMARLRAGDLNHLTGGPARPPAEGQLTREHLRGMTPDQIQIARAAGRLDDLLNRNR